ncbi:hypothetical protein [Lyngbya sp. PCC 8106]|uniref:hypothetical protein n=1 Tax=Lyngbya sp. (strain PCC 8106) TaxID=313612 RepID=UPI0000EAB1B0|nr:hypothetical protein [Lyngbya sp. PCC 8106]EAW35710.1 hypothetical protein L8106_27921 [Lyngbya sp. PCC 8106]
MTQQPSSNNQRPVEKLKQFLKKVESKQNLISALGGITTLIGAIAGAIIFLMKPEAAIPSTPPANCSGFLVYIPADSDTIKNLESKIDCYRDLIANNPKDAVAYTNLGEAERRLSNIKNHRINKRMNELEVAKKHHLTAQKLDFKSKEVQQGLSTVNQDIEYLEKLKEDSISNKFRETIQSRTNKIMTFNQQQ